MKLRRLLLGKKVMTNLDSTFKGRDITLLTKVHLVQAMVFPVVMYGCENCTIKQAERWRIDAFELWCWRRLLRVPRTARKSNYSISPEIHWKKIFRKYFRAQMSDWTDPVYCLRNFAFSRMSYRWNHTVIYTLYINSAILLLGINPTDKWRYMQKTFCKRDWKKKIFNNRGHIKQLINVRSQKRTKKLSMNWYRISSKICCCLVTRLCLTLCNPMDCSVPSFPILHHLLELAQTHVHQISDTFRNI